MFQGETKECTKFEGVRRKEASKGVICQSCQGDRAARRSLGLMKRQKFRCETRRRFTRPDCSAFVSFPSDLMVTRANSAITAYQPNLTISYFSSKNLFCKNITSNLNQLPKTKHQIKILLFEFC